MEHCDNVRTLGGHSFTRQRHQVGAEVRLNQNLLIEGDSRQALQEFAPESIQTVITSPPYWSLRDYGIPGQIGLSESVYSYVEALAGLFESVFRALRSDGTLWLNVGDVYTSGNRAWRAPDRKNPARAMAGRHPTPVGLKDKDLIGIPWRIAFALQDRGWYLRSEVIWRKPNAQPESVRDRPTRDHEQVFLFSKSERYKYHVDREKGPNDRRLRTVWDINTKVDRATSGHFATFPMELVERCMNLTTDPGDVVLDPFLGSGTTALVAGKMSRRFLGIELNPEYLDICERRLAAAGFSKLPEESELVESDIFDVAV